MSTTGNGRAMHPSAHGHYLGKFRGTVNNNQDPLNRGRIQVLVPQVLNDSPAWAMPCVPFAGKNMGFFAIPDNGTGVWVEFEAGDPSYPIWTGFFWNKDDIPVADADPNIKFFVTKKFTLRIDDSVGEITIKNDSGSQIVLSAMDIAMKSSAVSAEGTGGKKIVVDATGFNVNDAAFEVL
jgi:uncharacterized protein involved in type VI secretion and phage assembly